MGIKVTGIRETMVRLERIHKKTHERQKDLLIKSGEDIAELSRDNAPRRTGALEKAIKSVAARSGVRGRYDVFVGVDRDKLGIGFKRYGVRYDELLHEKRFTLGEGSQRKAESGKDVGFEYITRAYEKLIKDISAKMEQIAKEESLR